MFLPGPASRLRENIGDEMRMIDVNSANLAEYARHIEDSAGRNHTMWEETLSSGSYMRCPFKVEVRPLLRVACTSPLFSYYKVSGSQDLEILVAGRLEELY